MIAAVIVDIGGTLVVEAPPGTPVADLEVRCLPGVLDDLRDLRAAGLRVGAATNTAVMDEAAVRALLGPVGLADLLEVVVTSAEVGAAKPDPRVLEVVLERLGGLRPDQALYIGNEPTDAAAAAAIGMPYADVVPEGLAATIRAWRTTTDLQPEGPGGQDQTPAPSSSGDGASGGRWERPVPLIGDTTSAATRASDPTAWRLPAEQREGLYAAIAARRDVRRFRPDPVPDDVVARLLDAAHAAPSVGHSQPWRFVLVTDPGTRERAALLADQERLGQAAGLTADARDQLLDLQLEGIREAPLGVIVCCDRRAPAAGVLGRRQYPDADLWSCACAIQNLWLAARAEGLGVGWVTLVPPADLAGLVGLPEGVEPLGWLCVGWPDERNPAPGLERVGWSRRLPVDDLVQHEVWGGRQPAPVAPISRLRAPEPDAVVGARDSADVLLTPVGSLGVLDRAVDRVLALGHGALTGGTLVLAVGRHRVTELGVSAFPDSVNDEVLAAARAGEAVGVVAAAEAGLAWRVVDAGSATGNVRDADALDRATTDRLVDDGRRLGAALAADGLVVLGEVGIGNTTVAAALAAGLLGTPAGDVVGLGAGADAAMVGRKLAVVDAALARVRGSGPTDPMRLLAALGGPELAVLTGVTLGAAEAGAPVVLDGLATSAAALVAVRIEPAVAAHLIAGQRSRERGHVAVLDALGLEPLLDLRIRAGEGVGACLAARLLLQALGIRRLSARTS